MDVGLEEADIRRVGRVACGLEEVEVIGDVDGQAFGLWISCADTVAKGVFGGGRGGSGRRRRVACNLEVAEAVQAWESTHRNWQS